MKYFKTGILAKPKVSLKLFATFEADNPRFFLANWTCECSSIGGK